ncbi:hypothetical protein [Roseicyclus persicicus]|uniref:Peptidase S1 n=1 Tax=Roseicyclus persicicus TaxID=2650661 RepID=A0A7X6H1F8_9RHOB|nr:hypothetical protein [Roseibacterium persicicum]NKX46284.1 hypothetical protein [Roseibacterium persicicum]
MMRRVIPCLLALAWPLAGGIGPALACPDPRAVPARWEAATGRDLWSPAVFPVEAGGDTLLSRCGVGGRGHVRSPPDFLFDLSRMGRYDRLHVRSNADCDTVLLLRDPAGRWHFDDDSGTGRTASLSLADPADGAYAIWVGTYRGRPCRARLTLETF